MYSVPKLVWQNSLKTFNNRWISRHTIHQFSLIHWQLLWTKSLFSCACKLNLHFIWSGGSYIFRYIYTVPQILCSKSVMSSLDIILVSDHCQKRLSIVHILSVLSLEVKITHHLTWIQTIQSIIISSPPQTNTRTHSFCRWFLLHKQVLDTCITTQAQNTQSTHIQNGFCSNVTLKTGQGHWTQWDCVGLGPTHAWGFHPVSAY